MKTKILHRLTQSQKQTFWRHIQIRGENDCWSWTKYKTPQGYGQKIFNGRVFLAHRVAYELAREAPLPGLLVCHTCDNPSCCNPRHLWLGTNDENVADCVKKGRVHCHVGENNPKRKLTEEMVLEIKASSFSRKRGWIGETAKKHGVTKSAISLIVQNRHWTHIGPKCVLLTSSK